MGVSSSIGPISGIDYGKLITGLTSLDQQPIDDITTQLNTLDQQNCRPARGLSTLMTGLKVSAANFTETSAVFRAATLPRPPIPAWLTANAGIGTATGNYSFNVQRPRVGQPAGHAGLRRSHHRGSGPFRQYHFSTRRRRNLR